MTTSLWFLRTPTRLLVGVLLAVVVAGCNGASPAPSPSAAAAGDPTPAPTGTRWPGRIISSVIALAAADAEFGKAADDLAQAAQGEDPERLLAAANGLAGLVQGSRPNAETLTTYPHTQATGERYLAAFDAMGAGADQLRKALESGDAEGVVAATQRLSEGVRLYGGVRREIGPLADQALLMRRMLVK